MDNREEVYTKKPPISSEIIEGVVLDISSKLYI